jgi:hypothetical protein
MKLFFIIEFQLISIDGTRAYISNTTITTVTSKSYQRMGRQGSEKQDLYIISEHLLTDAY